MPHKTQAAMQDRIEKIVRSIPFDTDKPSTVQIRDGIEALIRSGALKPGDQLPSLKKMAALFDVTTTTITNALHPLKKGTTPPGLPAGTVVTQDGHLTGIATTPKQNLKLIAATQKSERLLQRLPISRKPDQTLHQQIVNGIKKLVREGQLKPGDPIPPTRRLADIYDIAKGSCTRAIQILRRDNIITGRPGIGIFIATKPVKTTFPTRPDSAPDSPHMAQYVEKVIQSIPIDKNAPSPIYRQFRDGIEKLIRDGHLAMGDWLPTLNKMAILANIGQTSVVNAVHDLRRSRHLSTLFGVGTVVGSSDPLTPAASKGNTYPPADVEKLVQSIRIDRKSPVPAGQQLMAGIQALIKDGRLKPGDRLPTVKRLSAITTVSSNTITKVTRALSQQGVLTGKEGAGTVVAAGATATASLPGGSVDLESGHHAPQLAALIKAWDTLPAHIQQAILLIAEIRT